LQAVQLCEVNLPGRAADKTVDVSVVIPVCEGHGDVREIYAQYARELASSGYSCEFIFVIDARDGKGIANERQLKELGPAIRMLALNRSFGEAAALSLGFEKARAPVIVTLPAYFQVEPRGICEVIKTLAKNDMDLVVSRRFPVPDRLFSRLRSRVFHRLVRVVSGSTYRDLACGVRAMKRKVAEEVTLYGDLHYFFPILAYQRGFKIAEITVQPSRHDNGRRLFQPASYLRRLLDLLNLFFLVKFTRKPLRFFGSIGAALFASGTIITGYLGAYRLLGLGGIADRPLLILGVLLMVVGVQLFSIGLLGELIIFTHAREVKEYQIKDVLDD
jgi:glycosyltransferase involved in cell wall biosynthesis